MPVNIPRSAYAAMFGPPPGARARPADTDSVTGAEKASAP